MRNLFKNMDASVLNVIREIGRAADDKMLPAFLVGGFVRDLILDRKNQDVDVVLEGDAISFVEQLVKKKGLRSMAHKRFGTATIFDWNGISVDCVSARSETYPSPGALPLVRRASLKEDVFRRDFTMNALAVSINQKGFGTLIDLCGGVGDLQHGKIRAFHGKSFLDDPTRILRAVRFEQRFGFRFDMQTKRLLQEAIMHHAEKTVTPPRYFREFALGLLEEQPGKYLLRLKALGALDFLGDDIVISGKVLQFLDSQWKCKKGHVSGDPAVMYMRALYAGCTADQIKEWGRIFQWPQDQKKKVLASVRFMQETCPEGIKSPKQYIAMFQKIKLFF